MKNIPIKCKKCKIIEMAKNGLDSYEYCIQELEKENEELRKEINEHLYGVNDGNIHVLFGKPIKYWENLQKENEELKEEIRNYKMYGCSDAVQPNAYVVDSAYQGAIIGKTVYKQALEEIRELTNTFREQELYTTSEVVNLINKRESQLREIKTKIDEVLK